MLVIIQASILLSSEALRIYGKAELRVADLGSG